VRQRDGEETAMVKRRDVEESLDERKAEIEETRKKEITQNYT
jgi:hypothetical protein